MKIALYQDDKELDYPGYKRAEIDGVPNKKPVKFPPIPKGTKGYISGVGVEDNGTTTVYRVGNFISIDPNYEMTPLFQPGSISNLLA